MKRVIELIRVSSEGQADDDRGGIPAQRAANRRTAEQYGLEVIRTVQMIDVSGAAVLREPAMQGLLDDLGRDDIDGVVTREFSRLMRPDNYADYAILQRFKETNTLLYLPEGPLNFNDKSGRIIGTLQGLMSGLEREMIRERMMGGKEALRRMGRWAAGNHQLPFGVDYDLANYKFSYTPEAEKVREVFRRFLGGDQNYDALSDLLGLTRGTAKNILQNPIYRGWLVYSQKRDLTIHGQRLSVNGAPGRDRRKIERADEETYRHRVIEPGLISDADFNRVQELIATKQELNIRQRTRTGEFTYNGFLWCAKCGARIHTFRNQFDRFYYICSNKKAKNAVGEHLCPYTGYMNRDRLEPMLDHLVSKTLTDAKLLQGIYDHHRTERELLFPKHDRERLQDRYRFLFEKRDRTIDMAADGLIERSQCVARLKVIDRDIHEVHQKLTEANPVPAWTPRQLSELFAPFVGWSSLDKPAKRRILNGLSPKFTVADYQITGMHLGALSGPTEAITANIDRPYEMRTALCASLAPPCPLRSQRVSCSLRR